MVQTFLLLDTITNEKTWNPYNLTISSTVTRHLGLAGSNNFGEYFLLSIYFGAPWGLLWHPRERSNLLPIMGFGSARQDRRRQSSNNSRGEHYSPVVEWLRSKPTIHPLPLRVPFRWIVIKHSSTPLIHPLPLWVPFRRIITKHRLAPVIHPLPLWVPFRWIVTKHSSTPIIHPLPLWDLFRRIPNTALHQVL